MAIPFNLPSDEETENNYRSMDDLLLQLYRVVRQILLRRVPAAVEVNNQQNTHGRVPHPRARPHHEVDSAPPPDVVPRLPPPDVVSCCGPAPPAAAPMPDHPHPRAPPRRGRRRRMQRREHDAPEKEAAVEAAPRRKVEVRDNWTQVGEDLRQIADEFTTTLQDIHPKRLDTTANTKGVSFLSLLVPPPFRGSIWMAMVFLFGWGALHRLR